MTINVDKIIGAMSQNCMEGNNKNGINAERNMEGSYVRPLVEYSVLQSSCAHLLDNYCIIAGLLSLLLFSIFLLHIS